MYQMYVNYFYISNTESSYSVILKKIIFVDFIY